MFVFLYLLAAMGVAYWAKIDGRNPTFWFAAATLLTPLGGSVLLWAVNRYGPQT
jgi:hypothetical protein